MRRIAFGMSLLVFAAMAFPQSPAKQLLERYKETYPSVREATLARCKTPTVDCLSDIAWELAQGKAGYEVSWGFARLEQWQRADQLASAIAPTEYGKRQALAYIAGERLARQLSLGNLGPLREETDQEVLSHAARRIVGYPPDDRSRRLDGLEREQLIKAPHASTKALLAAWERLLTAGAPYGSLNAEYGRTPLAEVWLLSGDANRARAVVRDAKPREGYCDRWLIDVWLGLGEPGRALELAKRYPPKDRGYCNARIAKWLKNQGSSAQAAGVAKDAGNDFLTARNFDQLVDVVQLLVELGERDTARHLAEQADEIGWREMFAVFSVSAAGEMFGLVGDMNECQRLQAKALGVKTSKGEIIDWRSTPARASWEGGLFNLGRELTNEVAARRIGCGDRTALKDVDNRTLAQNYCAMYRRHRIQLSDIKGRAPKHDDDAGDQLLIDRATECHFELGETDTAMVLLSSLLDDRLTSSYGTAYSTAELACVYASTSLCDRALDRVTPHLLDAVSKRELPPQAVIRFANVWKARRLREN